MIIRQDPRLVVAETLPPLVVATARKPRLSDGSKKSRSEGCAHSYLMLIVLVFIFYFIQLAEKVAKLAGKTHKDRVAEFNNHLESLSEHHDIPKVCTSIAYITRNMFTDYYIARLDQDKMSIWSSPADRVAGYQDL